MRTKTTLYLSIIITSYFIGKLFNPIPLTNYAFYIIVVALFVPYFGLKGCVKIVFCLASISLIQDIPFYLWIYQQWPSIYQSIVVTTLNLPTLQHPAVSVPNPFHVAIVPWLSYFIKLPNPTTANLETIMAIQSNGLVYVSVLISAFYFGLINALWVLSKAYKKTGIYKRIVF